MHAATSQMFVPWPIPVPGQMTPRTMVEPAVRREREEHLDSRSPHEYLRRYAEGDDQAFGNLVAVLQPTALVQAARITGSRDDAADVVQEALWRIAQDPQSALAAASFIAWFTIMVRHLAIDVLRRRQRRERRHVGSAEHTASVAAQHDHGLQNAETRQRVALVLAQIPTKYRDLLVMREMEGQPAEAIATTIGIDYGTTRWRLHEARRLFRQAWLATYGEDHD